jgi:hypothetical protein
MTPESLFFMLGANQTEVRNRQRVVAKLVIGIL